MRALPVIALLLAACPSVPVTESVAAVAGALTDGGTFGGPMQPAAPGTLRLTLAGFQGYEAKTARLKVTRAGTDGGRQTSAQIADGGAVLVLTGALEPGTPHVADVFVDADGDGQCSPCATSTEPAWRRSLDAGSGDVDVALPFDTGWVDVSPW